MESGASDVTVVPNQEGEESSMVLAPSIQASLHRTSSAVSEIIAVGDVRSTVMEPSLPVASSKNSEIIEAEGDPSPGMEPSLPTTSMRHPVEDKQSSKTGSTSSPKMKVNKFIEDLSEASYDEDALVKHFSKLKRKLDDGLRKGAVYAFLEHNMTEAQQKVQELFNLFEAIEFVISNWRMLLKKPIKKEDPDQPKFQANYRRIDIYYRLFIHALHHALKLRENPSVGQTHTGSITVANLFEHFEATDFIVFLIKKVQEEEIIHPLLNLQEAKTLITKCVHRYEEEIISTFICLVVNDEDDEAEELFKSLLNHTKPSDIIDRGRVYNYALQKAEELDKVHKFLSSPNLSQRYKAVVHCNNRLNWFAMEHDYQVKVHRFLVDLYLRDVDLKKKIDWEFVEQHDYLYLIHCVWECHKWRVVPNDVTKWKWTPLQLKYVLTSSAAMTVGGLDIIKRLLEAWPTIVNAPYKGITALHVAAWRGNEEVVDYLLKQNELDINVRTIPLLTADDVKKLLKKWMPKVQLDVTAFNKGLLKCKDGSPSYATLLLKDHEDLIKDLLLQQEIEVDSKGCLHEKKFLTKYLSSGKKNRNRWKMPAYQTALHIATAQGNVNVVKLLCDAPEPHQQRLRCLEKDEENHTPLDIIYSKLNEVGEDFPFAKIEKILLNKQEVQNVLDRLHQYRQILVDAVNTILVGAALIASVAFVGWLQPPLGYVPDYDLAVSYPAPPDTYDSYLAVQGNLGVKAFALFNSLSFFFAIATVIVGADAAFPLQSGRYQYIGHITETMDRLLRRAIKFLIVSLVCVLGAFGSAAIAVLPPSLFFRKDLVLSIIIGGVVCGYALWQLLSRHSKRVQRINASIRHVIKFTNVF